MYEIANQFLASVDVAWLFVSWVSEYTVSQ